MPDIQTLTSVVQNLETSASRWSRGALWLVAATAIVATLYFIVSWVASKKATALQEAQATLIHAKDSQLSRDLKDKDVSISAADQKAADAKQETARLTKEAEQAKTERAEADKQIEIAKADALRAKEGIANAEAVSAKAGVEVARLQVIVANAEQKRAEAEKALRELQERTAWRTITPAQRETFLTAVKDIPKGKIRLNAPDGDPEALTFANHLISLLTEAGWTVQAQSMMPIGSTPIGLSLYIPRLGQFLRNDPLYHAVILEKTLEAIGLEVSVMEDKNLVEPDVLIWVGHKPAPKP